MSNLKIVMYFTANVLGMAGTLYHNEIPYIISAIVWAVGLAGLMTQIVLYSELK